MEKHRFVGKTKEEAIENAKIGLQELEENLIIKETEVQFIGKGWRQNE